MVVKSTSTFQIPRVWIGILLCAKQKRSGDFRTAGGNLKFYKSCLCQERPGFPRSARWTFGFHSPGFPRVVRQALVWRCSWNAYGTKTGLRKFVVPFPLERRWCLIPKKPEMLGSFSRRIFQMFFQIANCLKKTPRTGSTLAACPENSEVCLWTSVPLAQKVVFFPNPRCSMGLAVFTYSLPPKLPSFVGK